MKKICLIFAITLLLQGCNTKSSENDSTNLTPVKTSPEATTHESLLYKKIESMSLEERVGQLIMTGFEGTTVSDVLRSTIEDSHIGNVILFSSNISSTKQLQQLNDEILNLNTEYPIWIAVDEEGGNVSRIPSELVTLPTAATLASNYTSEQVFNLSSHLSLLLHALGFTIDFAPVIDVNSNPNNPVIGTRAFSDNPETVSEYAISFNDGLREHSILGVGKHFPGHGDTNVDSHYGLPVINKTLEQLKVNELIPFQNAIDSNFEMLMVGHLFIPSLDSKYPASQSGKIMNDLLREDMGYDGIIITDDLVMDAIQTTIPNAAIQAISSGADMVLIGHDIQLAIKSSKAIVHAVESGIISEKQLNESVARVLTLKETYTGNIDDQFDENVWNVEMSKLLSQK